MKITIFTLDMHFDDDTPDKTLDSPFHKFCMSTWSRVLNYIEGQGFEAELIIYDNDSEEYKTVENEIFKNWTTKSKAHYADAFRMYILSKHPNYMWIDWDVFIREGFKFGLDKPYLMLNWFIVYNSTNLSLFEAIYNSYKNFPDLQFLSDKGVSEFLVENKIIEYDYDKLDPSILIHGYFLDNNPSGQLYFITTEEEDSDFVKEHIEDKHNYRFINPKTKNRNGIKGMYGEKELIKYVLDNYELSEHSREVLEDAYDDN